MKKILAIILSLCLLCGAVAFADTTVTQDSTDQTAKTQISYTVVAEVIDDYTVTIPASMTLAPIEAQNNRLGAQMNVTLTVADGFNAPNKGVYVRLSSANNYKLSNGTDNAAYQIFNTASESATDYVGASYSSNGNQVVVSYTGTEALSQTRVLKVLTNDAVDVISAKSVGEYKDTLTFTVALEDLTAAQ